MKSISVLIVATVAAVAANTTLFIHTPYAKVASFGAATNNRSTPGEARSSSGQTLWTHRSDANVISGQNLEKEKPYVVYYSVSKPEPQEPIPAEGEIQERFNPPPYFDYTKPDKQKKPSFDSYSYDPPKQQDTQPDADVYDSPYTSYNPPKKTESDSNDATYDSPYTSYNPPKKTESDSSDASYDSPYSSYNPPKNSESDSNEATYDSPYSSYNPPAKAPATDGPMYNYPPKIPEAPSNSYLPAATTTEEPKHDDFPGPYAYIPKKPYDVADSPTPPATFDSFYGQPQEENHMHGMMAEDDMVPPPPQPHHVPEYLDHDPKEHGYDLYGHDHDHDHHVYHEVTTTTEMPEDTRVNKGQYSYYYLGRKLWYVPLYFSIYFIIYVTILILKSIARHKIDLKHQHLHHKYRSSRGLDVEETQRRVDTGIDSARKMFM